VRFIFDMRGFWIDERFERGIWPRGHPAYSAIAAWLRKRERDLFTSSDAVVSLTEAAREELTRRGDASWAEKTSVIPCCVDLAHFDPRGGEARARGKALLGLDDDAPVLLYLGSVGGAYPLSPVLRFFKAWTGGRRDARLLFVTRDPSASILGHPDASALHDQLIFRAAERAEVPALVAAADAGVSFILPSFCAVASSPTKVGEMLAMGLPVAANDRIGDIGLIMSEPAAGVLLPDFSDAAIEAAAISLRPFTSPTQAARRVAESWFALEQGVETYDRLYRALLPPRTGLAAVQGKS
jgi:glycosyltransferase involved in cell wall biosynthesis